jgi:bleomycin hydrolase
MKRQRENNTVENTVGTENEVTHQQLKKYRKEFEKDQHNQIIQNALCTNNLRYISEVRSYMQSIDTHFSHVLDPQLVVSDQKSTGRCWLFALLNIIRHDLIRYYNLPFDFELSQSYLSFYEKIEKCNHALHFFMNKDKLDPTDYKTQKILINDVQDGGTWTTCCNLIKKYGIIPKTCFRESVHSSDTYELNNLISSKVKEFAFELVNEKDKSKRLIMKETMMGEIYSILVKMLGTPPNINEKVNWCYSVREDMLDLLKKEKKRKRTGYETNMIKKELCVTPLEFYNSFVVNKLDDYCILTHDPRNEYYKYYQSYNGDIVVGGKPNGYYNLPIEEIAKFAAESIKNNYPVEIDIDAPRFFHQEEELIDEKVFNHNGVFNLKFDNLSKKDNLKCLYSYPTHALIVVSVDIEEKTNNIKKWRIENSWGSDLLSLLKGKTDAGHYIMSHSWFCKYAYSFVVHKKFIPTQVYKKYLLDEQNPIILPDNDILGY